VKTKPNKKWGKPNKNKNFKLAILAANLCPKRFYNIMVHLFLEEGELF
jgi:hypothetical protein